MLNIEYIENADKGSYNLMDNEFNKFAIKNGVTCNYKSFNFVAKEEDKIVGIIMGHSYYKEVYIDNLIVLAEYRNKHIGTKLIETVENYFKNKEFENINLTTYKFQAPEFYKKCGFKIDFIRENKKDYRLNKYYLVKYFK